MTKCALSAFAGFIGLCHGLSAQETQRPDQLGFDGSTLDRSYPRLPSITLEDRERFFFSTGFGSIQPTMGFLSPYSAVEPQAIAFPTTHGRRTSSDNVVEMRPLDRIRTGGEVGFLYGRSSGKYGREDFQTYIIGTVGNDYFHITAGASYETSSGRVPYWIRR